VHHQAQGDPPPASPRQAAAGQRVKVHLIPLNTLLVAGESGRGRGRGLGPTSQEHATEAHRLLEPLGGEACAAAAKRLAESSSCLRRVPCPMRPTTRWDGAEPGSPPQASGCRITVQNSSRAAAGSTRSAIRGELPDRASTGAVDSPQLSALFEQGKKAAGRSRVCSSFGNATVHRGKDQCCLCDAPPRFGPRRADPHLPQLGIALPPLGPERAQRATQRWIQAPMPLVGDRRVARPQPPIAWRPAERC